MSCTTYREKNRHMKVAGNIYSNCVYFNTGKLCWLSTGLFLSLCFDIVESGITIEKNCSLSAFSFCSLLLFSWMLIMLVVRWIMLIKSITHVCAREFNTFFGERFYLLLYFSFCERFWCWARLAGWQKEKLVFWLCNLAVPTEDIHLKCVTFGIKPCTRNNNVWMWNWRFISFAAVQAFVKREHVGTLRRRQRARIIIWKIERFSVYLWAVILGIWV